MEYGSFWGRRGTLGLGMAGFSLVENTVEKGEKKRMEKELFSSVWIANHWLFNKFGIYP